MATSMVVATSGGPVTVWFERRRYGSRTFTWGYAVAPDGEPLSLGDPWPVVATPKRSELAEAAEAAMIGRSLDRMARSAS